MIPVSATDISGLTSSLVQRNKPKPVTKKIYKVKVETRKVHEIKDAVVLRVPSNKYLGRKLSPSEEFNLEETMMEIIHQGITRTDSEYNEMLSRIKKSRSTVAKLRSLVSTRASYPQDLAYSKLGEAESYLLKKEAEIKHLLHSYKSLFKPDSIINPEKAQQINDDLILLCGPAAVHELRSLLQRNEKGRIANVN